MAEPFDERGEPIGTMPVEPMPPPQPPMAAPPQAGAPFIAPSLGGRSDVMPGPRGGMIVPQGGSVAGPSPQDRANVNAFMENMAKAGLMDKAEKDVEQAMRFLGMRGVERDVQAGTPYPQALSKHLPYLSWGDPRQAEAYSRVIQQAQPLSMQNLGGVQVLRTPRGDRIVPQSAIPQPPVTAAQSIPFTDPATGQPMPGHFAVPSPTGKGFTVHRRADQAPVLTPAQRRLELNDAIKDKKAEIEAVPWAKEKDKAAVAARQQQLGVLNAELRELQQQRPSAAKKVQGGEHSPSSTTAVPPKAERKIGQVYQTPKGAHRWTKDGWEPVS